VDIKDRKKLLAMAIVVKAFWLPLLPYLMNYITGHCLAPGFSAGAKAAIWVLTRIIPSCRHRGNSGFMIATPVGAVREPPLQFGILLV
jgi:hypothetical protein